MCKWERSKYQMKKNQQSFQVPGERWEMHWVWLLLCQDRLHYWWHLLLQAWPLWCPRDKWVSYWTNKYAFSLKEHKHLDDEHQMSGNASALSSYILFIFLCPLWFSVFVWLSLSFSINCLNGIASFLFLAKHVQGVRPDGPLLKELAKNGRRHHLFTSYSNPERMRWYLNFSL